MSTRGRQRFGCTSGSATRAPRCRLATLSWGTQAFLLSTRLQVSKRCACCFGGDQCSGAHRRSHRHGACVSVYKMSHPWRGPAVSHPEAQDASRRERLHMSLSLSLESCCPWHPTSEPCSLALQPLLPRSSRDTFSSYVTCPPSQAVWVQRASDPWTAVPGGRPRHVVAREQHRDARVRSRSRKPRPAGSPGPPLRGSSVWATGGPSRAESDRGSAAWRPRRVTATGDGAGFQVLIYKTGSFV